jgi:hypothetical protein
VVVEEVVVEVVEEVGVAAVVEVVVEEVVVVYSDYNLVYNKLLVTSSLQCY